MKGNFISLIILPFLTNLFTESIASVLFNHPTKMSPLSQLDGATENTKYCQFNYSHLVNNPV